MIRLKLVNSTGRPFDTFVVNAETGEPIAGICHIELLPMTRENQWEPRLRLEILRPHFDMLCANVEFSPAPDPVETPARAEHEALHITLPLGHDTGLSDRITQSLSRAIQRTVVDVLPRLKSRDS